MPSTKKNVGLSQLRVGLFVLVGLLILAFLILNSTGDFNPFAKRMKLIARFASADGLRDGAEVQLAGVHVGKVQQVRFLPPDSPGEAKIEAVMTVNQMLDGKPISERIRTDSTAQLIATTALANDKMINITPGSVKGDPVEENHVLESSAAISINQLTQTGNDLLEQINKLAVPTNQILNKANQGEGTLGRIINDQSLYKNLDSSVGEAKITMLKLQNILDRVKSGDGSAGKLLNDPALYNSLNNTINELEGISKDLRAGKGTAGKFLSDDALYNETRATIAEVKTSLADARESIKRLNKIADQVEVLAKDLNEGKGTLGKFITDESLFNNINQTTANVNQITSEGTKLVYDFRQNPRKYLTIKFKLF